MKILLISYKFYPSIGGIEVNSEILAGHFTRLGADVSLVTYSQESGESGGREFPFKVMRKPSIVRLWKEHMRADVVFENNPSMRLAWPLYFSGKRHVIAVRTWIERADGRIQIQDRVKLRWLRKADAVIAISQKIKESSCLKAIVIGNPYRDELFRILNSEKKDRHFVFMGRLVSDKGADMAINFLRMINAKKTGSERFTLSVVGDGPERSNLVELVNKHSLTDCVHFTGFLEGEALVQCLNRHKYILIPSRWKEPFGNIALEGMACGCLPIVSNGGGLPEAVGNAGVVFERNSLRSLFDNVNVLLENPDLEVHLRSNFEKHLTSHRPQFVAGEYYKIIETVFSS